MLPSLVVPVSKRPSLPAAAFIAAFLILIPTFWHWPTRLTAWLFITNVIYGTNSLVWSDGVQDKAPIWCDICESFVSKVTGTAPTAFAPQPASVS